MKKKKKEHWSELPFPSSEDLPDPGIKPRPPALQVESLPSEPPGKLLDKPLHPWWNFLAKEPSEVSGLYCGNHVKQVLHMSQPTQFPILL